jgi:hypothetical protein
VGGGQGGSMAGAGVTLRRIQLVVQVEQPGLWLGFCIPCMPAVRFVVIKAGV